MLNLPDKHEINIQKQLFEGKRLIAGLCASWCENCESWQIVFSSLSDKYPDYCFVWLDIEDHPDMVAEVDLDILPVLLVQDRDNILFLGPVRPDREVAERIIQSTSSTMQVFEPGIRDFLIEGCSFANESI
ncbi:MAG: thioredoxin domain-containing protein [Limnobaculum xujianqingii]